VKKKEIEVRVINPEKFFQEEKPEIKMVVPLLGLKLLSEYNTLFRGKKREIALFHP
jgi:hypothetical protein